MDTNYNSTWARHSSRLTAGPATSITIIQDTIAPQNFQFTAFDSKFKAGTIVGKSVTPLSYKNRT